MNCTICTADVGLAAERYACTGCEYAMRYALRQLVLELPSLRAAMAPGSPSGGRRPVGRAHSPLPVNLRVLDLLGPGLAVPLDGPEQTAGIPIGPLLQGWVRYTADQYLAAWQWRHGPGSAPPAAKRRGTVLRGIPGWSVRLAAQLPWIVTRPWVADLDLDLRDALARVRAVTGSRPQRHPRLAPCPDCGAFALSLTDGQWEIRCELCGHRLDRDAYAAHAAAVLPALGRTMALIATAVTPAPTT